MSANTNRERVPTLPRIAGEYLRARSQKVPHVYSARLGADGTRSRRGNSTRSRSSTSSRQTRVTKHVRGLRGGRSVANDNAALARMLHDNPFRQRLVMLVTDLAGFTATTERLGDMRARQLIRDHNELMRGCLAKHAGREVFHTGDGVFAAFASVESALTCACAMQSAIHHYNRAHSTTPLRLRVGLHAGSPLQDEDRLFGLCVNATVRVCSACDPGHITLSSAVLDRVDTRAWRLRPRGPFVLHGITKPMQLYDLSWDSARGKRSALAFRNAELRLCHTTAA